MSGTIMSVDRAVYWDMDDAMCWAVDVAVRWVVHDAVFDAVDEAVYQPLDGPGDRAVVWVVDEPDRPFLLDFLGSAEVGCATRK